MVGKEREDVVGAELDVGGEGEEEEDGEDVELMPDGYKIRWLV